MTLKKKLLKHTTGYLFFLIPKAVEKELNLQAHQEFLLKFKNGKLIADFRKEEVKVR